MELEEDADYDPLAASIARAKSTAAAAHLASGGTAEGEGGDDHVGGWEEGGGEEVGEDGLGLDAEVGSGGVSRDVAGRLTRRRATLARTRVQSMSVLDAWLKLCDTVRLPVPAKAEKCR